MCIFVYKLVIMVNNLYRFTSDVEPTDIELELLMNEVMKDVKSRAKNAELKIKEIRQKYLNEVTKHQLAKQKSDVKA